MTRSTSFFAILLAGLTPARAQVIELTFLGQFQSAPIALDSIVVINLADGGDSTIYYPENQLVLGSTGIRLPEEAPWQLTCAPNPFAGQADVRFTSIAGGAIDMDVHDARGIRVASLSTSVGEGLHRFRFTSAHAGVHVLSVRHAGTRKSIRLLASEGTTGAYALEHSGAESLPARHKSGGAFLWSPGDALRCTGYASDSIGPLSGLLDIVPSSSSTETFMLARGARCAEVPVLVDIDGNSYGTVRIGNQCWMQENLRTGSYSDGSPIPHVPDSLTWVGLQSAGWCNYMNDPALDPTLGKLYNWYAVGDAAGICPLGWHVPSDADWQQLEQALGMTPWELGSIATWRGSAQNVGGKLKTTTLWYVPNAGATNETGFSAIPVGDRDTYGDFHGYTQATWFWSSTQSAQNEPYYRLLSFMFTGIMRRFGAESDKRLGFCVRCVMD